MASNYVCNLIVPGAAKSGTSSLHELLELHPQISMSDPKEPHHFARRERFLRGALEHNALFETDGMATVFGESSTSYLPSITAADRIKQSLKNPKVIMVLREPVERTLSHYRWRYRLGLEKRPLIKALKESGRGYDPEQPTEYGYTAYLDFSNYSKHCEYWLKLFGQENCLLINSEHLKNHKRDTLASCLSFLGVGPMTLSELPENKNATKDLGRRSPRIATRTAALVPRKFKASRLYKKIRSESLKLAAGSPPQNINDEEENFLLGALADDIEWFHSKFGRK